MHAISLLSVLSCLVAMALSWQTEIHQQIGFMADLLISPTTRFAVANLLEPEYNGTLGLAAGWADNVRKDPLYSYSYVWHFISARDDPPNDCGLYYHRDCQKGGCVVQQIANQTRILERCVEDVRDGKIKPTAALDCSNSLKWVAHFVGDVAQPLHTSDRSYGGNAVKVLFNGTQTNLHQVWDKEIIYAMTKSPRGFPPSEGIAPFFTELLARLENDSFRSPRSTWAMCDLDSRRGTYCAEQWAKDSNAIVCDYAYGRWVNGSDLWTGEDQYALGAMPIIEQQIAKAAWRLTGWLNALVERVFNAEIELGGEGRQERLGFNI